MEKEQTNRNMDGIVEKKVLAEICFEEELAPTCKTQIATDKNLPPLSPQMHELVELELCPHCCCTAIKLITVSDDII